MDNERLTTYVLERTRTIKERASVVLDGSPTDEQVLALARDPTRIWRGHNTREATYGEPVIVVRVDSGPKGYL